MGFHHFFWSLVLFSWKGSFDLAMGNNNTNRLSLLAFKEGITQDPHQVMNSWNYSTHFCMWMGVTCSIRHQRVVVLTLVSSDLVGTISPSVGNLSSLTTLNLSSNNFQGKIAPELSRLSHLQHLDLSHNSLEGEIPLNLSTCSELSVLSLEYNSLIGSIPYQVSSLKKISFLYLGVNYLTGIIPHSVGNCSSIRVLSLMQNSLQGGIPNELGQLSQLQFFQVSSNMLSGTPPPSLLNITSIYFFSVADNDLEGRIPPNVGETLPNLKSFLVGANKFKGAIPDSLSNASDLFRLDLAQNFFTGSISKNLGSLTSLSLLNLESNRLGDGHPNDLNFMASLSNCTVLESFHLGANRLGGVLPQSIGNLSIRLQRLTMGRNLIAGPLPTSIQNLINLKSLRVYRNSFNGSIPFGIGNLQNLHLLDLFQNKFSGQIPSSLGNLTLLVYLYMDSNRLEGFIGNCKGLLRLVISSNKLSGTIPKQLFALSSLFLINVSNNSLNGSLPLEVGTIINLELLDISKNNLSGDIPVTVGSCLKLEILLMEDNLFQGSIPQSLKNLKGISFIDFSHNNLSRKIPEFLMNLSSLEYLDLSYNDFEGKVPTEGIFMNASTISVGGNEKLCGGIKELGLPLCKDQEVETSRNFLSLRKIIIIASGVTSFILVVICCFANWLRTFRKLNAASAATTSSSLEKWKRGATYSEIFASTDGFSLERLIGTGSIGSVYKGVLSDNETSVAIKVMNLQHKGAAKSFIAECEALRNIKHRNLTKVITVCSSIDFQGNDFKALIFELMPNGSIEQWLHPATTDDRQQSRTLSLNQRLNIAVDVALGLEYLHYGHGETVVHCDIKPSNILLDIDMTAHVGDFGLAKFLLNASNDQQETQTHSSCLKGSIGYIPPEYGMDSKVSTHGDMYSYGILLMEMFTGKRPTDEMFRDGLNLYSFVAMALPNDVMDIVDASLLSKTVEEDEDEKRDPRNVNEREEAPALRRTAIEGKREKCLVSVLTVALSCCAPLPKDRRVASYIVTKLIDVRDLFCHAP